MGKCRADEIPEQGVRAVGPAAQLGVILHADKPWMAGHLDDFHQIAVRVYAADAHSGGFKQRPVCIVEFIAVTVPLP